ncbi:MAG: hypothetical protein QM627_04700 [Luteolibacter sp.]
MKTPIFLFFMLLLGSNAQEQASCSPLVAGQVKAWETAAKSTGQTRSIRWGIDATTMNEERIVLNTDGSVRGRVITTYKGGKQHMVLAYRGATEAWFVELWTWKNDGSYTVETRKTNGELIVKTTVPADKNEVVKMEDTNGHTISPEFEKRFAKEIADTLF